MTRATRELYDDLGKRYDRWTYLLDRGAFNRVRREVFQRASGRVLEIAIGTGKNFRFFPPGCELVGIDFSASMLAAAQRKAQQDGFALEIHAADANALPFEAATFDTVVCSFAICTFKDPLHVLGEVRRVLKADGQLLLVEHVRGPTTLTAAFCDAVTPLSRRFLGCHASRQSDALVAEAGFSVEVVARAMGGILLGMVAGPGELGAAPSAASS